MKRVLLEMILRKFKKEKSGGLKVCILTSFEPLPEKVLLGLGGEKEAVVVWDDLHKKEEEKVLEFLNSLENRKERREVCFASWFI